MVIGNLRLDLKDETSSIIRRDILCLLRGGELDRSRRQLFRIRKKLAAIQGHVQGEKLALNLYDARFDQFLVSRYLRDAILLLAEHEPLHLRSIARAMRASSSVIKSVLDVLKSAGLVSVSRVKNLTMFSLTFQPDSHTNGTQMIPQPEYRDTLSYFTDIFRRGIAEKDLEGDITGSIIFGNVAHGTANPSSKCQTVVVIATVSPEKLIQISEVLTRALSFTTEVSGLTFDIPIIVTEEAWLTHFFSIRRPRRPEIMESILGIDIYGEKPRTTLRDLYEAITKHVPQSSEARSRWISTGRIREISGGHEFTEKGLAWQRKHYHKDIKPLEEIMTVRGRDVRVVLS